MSAPEKAPFRVQTERLVLRKPNMADAQEIYERYASDPLVTRYLAWPTHTGLEDTRMFLTFSDAQWAQWPVGPYLIEERANGRLLGGTGLGFEPPETAMTGYVLARDAWGQGYATEALEAVVEVAAGIRIKQVYTLCHVNHKRSIHVLEKCGFRLEGRSRLSFPNLDGGREAECLRYARVLAAVSGRERST